MKAIDIKLGTKVCATNHVGGKVIANSVLDSDEAIIIEWPDQSTQKYNVNDVIFTDAIERKWKIKIATKMSEAANLIAEANDIARANNVYLVDLHTEIHPLLEEMDLAGWVTTDLTC